MRKNPRGFSLFQFFSEQIFQAHNRSTFFLDLLEEFLSIESIDFMYFLRQITHNQIYSTKVFLGSKLHQPSWARAFSSSPSARASK